MTVTQSKLFRGLRKKLNKYRDDGNAKIVDLLYCPYCLMHWLSCFFALFIRLPITGFWLIDFIITAFSITGIATAFSILIDEFLRRLENVHHS